MDRESRLSRIETLWSVVLRAHDGSNPNTASAQEMLLEQYGGAIRRYLLAALRSEDAANEVFQEFALKFVRGDFEKVSPDKGRFRQFVKTVIYRMIVDYQRKQKKNRRHKDLAEMQAAVDPTSDEQLDADFTNSWRDELLARSWTALKERESETGKPYYTILRLRVDNPNLRSGEIAEQLSVKLGREIKSGNARVLVHRSREIFAEFLLDFVAESLSDQSNEELELELISLDLLSYCRSALDARKGEPKGKR